nr:YaeQ family protein [Marinifaba aquimaris]
MTMAAGDLLIKAEIDVSRIDAHAFEHIENQLVKPYCQSEHQFIQKLIAYALLHHNDISINQGNNDEPELFIRRNQTQFSHWIELGELTEEKLEKAEAKSEHVWLFCDENDHVAKLKQKINKHPKLQLVELESKMVDGLAQQIARNMAWTLILDQDQLSIASGDQFWSSKINIYHPLTIPFYDIIH